MLDSFFRGAARRYKYMGHQPTVRMSSMRTWASGITIPNVAIGVTVKFQIPKKNRTNEGWRVVFVFAATRSRRWITAVKHNSLILSKQIGWERGLRPPNPLTMLFPFFIAISSINAPIVRSGIGGTNARAGVWSKVQSYGIMTSIFGLSSFQSGGGRFWLPWPA